MARTQPTNVTLVSTRLLTKENVGQIISNIDPVMTPGISSMRRVRTGTVEFECLRDELSPPVENAVEHGANASFLTTPSPKRYFSRCQLMDKAIVVSDQAQANTTHGYSNELLYQLGKKSRELKRDQELRVCNHYSSVIGSSSNNDKWETSGISSWLETNFTSLYKETGTNQVFARKGGYVSSTKIASKPQLYKNFSSPSTFTGEFDLPAPENRYNSSATENTGSATDIAEELAARTNWTEQNIRDMLTNIIMQEDMIRVPTIMMSIRNKERASRILTGLAGSRGSRTDQTADDAWSASAWRDSGLRQSVSPRGKMGAAILANVEQYVSDWGVHRLMFNRWMDPTWLLFLDPRHWRLRYYQDYSVINIARTGHAEKRMMRVNFGVECLQEKGSGIIVGVNDGGT